MNTENFEKNLAMLNPEQLEAVETLDGPVMVIAGPGTGKTQIIGMRTANIILKAGVNAENILITTFTEAGVIAIRERLISMIGTDAYKVHVATIHSFSQDVIKTFPEKFTQEKLDTPIDDIESMEILSGIVSDDDVVLGGTPVFTFASAELGTDISITTTGFIITGSDNGNYTLTQPTLSADIVTTLGVDDITDVKFSLKLYPNPAINYIRVIGLSEKANYIIYNLLGKKVGKGIVENDEDITVQNLSNGTYFIRIENAKAIKFIKM